jgi:LCP family protein required for cell wall assembly
MDSIRKPKKRSAMRVPMKARRDSKPKTIDNQTLEISDIVIEDKQTDTVQSAQPEAAIEVQEPNQLPAKPSRKQRRSDKRAARKAKQQQRTGIRRHITLRRSIIALLSVLVITGAAFGYKVFMATRNVFSGSANLAPALDDLGKLKGEGDGRVNIALLGIGGGDHSGGNLSDTMMVASLDVKTKDVAIVSVPRDLYVKIPGYGYDKINASHAYGEKYDYKGGGGALAKKTLEDNLGVPVHYYARIDFEGFKKAIDVVGGITITNKETLIDPEYPCDNNPYRSCGYKLTPGTYQMNGLQALKYARCRKGTCGDDYGRAARQQEVLVALRKKALSLGTLSNPTKIAALIDVVGGNFKTDLSFNEIKKLVQIGKDIDTNKIISKVLTNSPNDDMPPLVQNGFVGGASVVIPTAGVGNMTAIRAFMRSLFVDNYIKSENAKIEIQNGTSRAGLAATTAALLKGYAYNVVTISSADKTTYGATVIYDYTNGKKPSTIKYLENRFKVKAVKASAPAAVTNTDGTSTTVPDIRIIIGSNYVAEE